uniref:MEMO1 family protein n=1 Tax=Mantoniella antarctica TaxID=81844 RepID=A0A7S0T795_9CHLO|mmetsp:Transcript_9906/g.24417  ORF Transcript_9906/g.24417 Transcript_9906/m.24417 type:complete len:293 (+) Transcript_9906:59-937(+)
MGELVRAASHAGSWYTDDGPSLSKELDKYIAAAGKHPKSARALIVPHAGYSYSGPAAAWGYKCVNPDDIARVFLLGPSHHVFLHKCALSRAGVYRTPLGDLAIDKTVYSELRATGQFMDMELGVDESEHSLEMHLPYIVKTFESRESGMPPLVPIMVGALTPAAEAAYGALLAKYLDDPANLFIISSDFCHWGKRFDYTPWDKSAGRLHQAIEALDRMGMKIIEAKDPDAFTEYIARFKNTICGRHPIGVFLQTLRQSQSSGLSVAFTRYEQSSACEGYEDSSVSYASAVVF